MDSVLIVICNFSDAVFKPTMLIRATLLVVWIALTSSKNIFFAVVPAALLCSAVVAIRIPMRRTVIPTVKAKSVLVRHAHSNAVTVKIKADACDLVAPPIRRPYIFPEVDLTFVTNVLTFTSLNGERRNIELFATLGNASVRIMFVSFLTAIISAVNHQRQN